MERRKKPVIRIIVATTEPCRMPEDPMYLPLQVGSSGKPGIGYARDDTGDNISRKNACYCELTGLYWAWKNLPADYIGLVHYRRYFRHGPPLRRDPYASILRTRTAQRLLRRKKLIVPCRRRYFIETLQSHYAHTQGDAELVAMREILAQSDPPALRAWNRALGRTWGYMFNMMVLPRTLLDEYCSWLFPLLDELYTRIGTAGRTDFQKRYVGRIGELLFNVWLEKKKQEGILQDRDIGEVPFLYIGKVDIRGKVKAFLAAKFLHRRQEHSF